MSDPQNDRATAEDYAWIEELARKCDAGEGHGDIGYRVVWSARYRRILNSLRAAPVAPDREALGRALYIIAGHSDDAKVRTEDWTAPYNETLRIFYGEQADRLVRILGGSLPYSQAPTQRWGVRCRKRGGRILRTP